MTDKCCHLPYQVNPFSDTHCVCSFEKNYRLQDIQLSKNRLRASARRRDKATTCRDSCQSLVENTGLEPVTSWLQTRRSPS